ncbi:Mut7-C RNAse domain-containing protein [Candidatus Micrarchaeota archaeon]|nr:Mut7-C RNAse domain-containing protein [Candidatus Micrarchaeota archaeon]
MRFLFDEMLKRTASWCRIFGLDVEFLSGKTDSELLDYAKTNKLVFVTRDVELATRCRKRGVDVVFVANDDREEQIAQIIKESGAELTFPENTRCPDCNGMLVVVDGANVKDDVPEKVAERETRFWRCVACKKVYWEGGHWKNITRVHGKVKELLARMQAP